MMRKNTLLLAATGLALALASGPASALTMTVTRTNSTTDNDNSANEDADTSGSVTGSPVVLADVVSATGSATTRGAGYAESFDQNAGIVQTVDYTGTFAVTASANVTYSITFNNALHGLLKIADELADESGDVASISTMAAVLKQDAVTIGDVLDLSGGSRSTAGSTNVDDTAAQTITGLTGSHTFTVRYTGSVTATSVGATLCANQTEAAALWGANGAFGAYCNAPADWDEYGSTAARDADGIFLGATVVITSVVPEPGTALLLGAGLLGLAVQGRKRT